MIIEQLNQINQLKRNVKQAIILFKLKIKRPPLSHYIIKENSITLG